MYVCLSLQGILSLNKPTKVYQVNWLRARSRRDRWREELSVTQHEMVWVLLWLQNEVGVWSAHAMKMPNSPGLVAYAHQLASNWKCLAKFALTRFLNLKLSDVFRYNEISLGF